MRFDPLRVALAPGLSRAYPAASHGFADVLPRLVFVLATFSLYLADGHSRSLTAICAIADACEVST